MTKLKIAAAVWTSMALAGLSAGNASAADVDKMVAVCADCHGVNGASTDSEVPIIGGYSSEFMAENLGAYKTRDRDCPATKFRTGLKKGATTDMCEIVQNFSDDDIKAVADYFAKQPFVRAKQKFDAALAEKGKELHQEKCEKCHSEGGTVASDDVGLPAGQWTAYLRRACHEFRDGKRPVPKKMKAMLDELDEASIEALLNYYASFQ
jgi:sulfide dehydrogenase cytochrome subunit